jgi:hypothetical protein
MKCNDKKPEPMKPYTRPTLAKRDRLADVSESGPVVISGIVIGASP